MTTFIRAELDRYCYWQEEREKIRFKKEILGQDAPWTENDSVVC